jgi:short-subunit dehydrogenase
MAIFITGASSGIGEALAREYRRRRPQSLIGLAARRADELERLATALGADATAVYPLDVNDREALRAAARDFVERGGPPEVVVANAGISVGTVTGKPQDADAFERVVRTNVVSIFDTFSPFVPAMTQAGRGRLVGIASVAGVRGLPGAGGYSASKAAAIAYLESLRVELRGSGVRVVTIAPGFIRTPMTAANRYRMPFLTDVDVFARKAVDAIDAGRSFVVIPWQMGVVAAVLRAMPDALFDRVFARAPRKQRSLDARGPRDDPGGPSR